jgi:hypothetical protein
MLRAWSVMKQARERIVSVEGFRPVISQSIHTRGWRERDSGIFVRLEVSGLYVVDV